MYGVRSFGNKTMDIQRHGLKAMMGDKVIMNAVKVEEDVNIPDDKFEVPEGISITDTPVMNMNE